MLMSVVHCVQGSMHEVCEIVYAQMEVWWDVVPVRFVLDPPLLSLHHSRRYKQLILLNLTEICEAK